LNSSLDLSKRSMELVTIWMVPKRTKAFCFRTLLFIALFTSSGYLLAQTCSDGVQNGTETGVDCGGTCTACTSHNMPATGALQLSVCDGGIYTQTTPGSFYDSGGSAGNYSTNNNAHTFMSNTLGQVEISVNMMALSSGDVLNLYDGSGPAAPLLHTWDLSNNQLLTFYSSNGGLYFEFISDGAVNSSGWDIDFYCTPNSCSDGLMNGIETAVDCGGNCNPCVDLDVPWNVAWTATDCNSGTLEDPMGPGNYTNNNDGSYTLCADPGYAQAVEFYNIDLASGDFWTRIDFFRKLSYYTFCFGRLYYGARIRSTLLLRSTKL